MKIALSVAEMSVGGIATFVLNLSQALSQAGHEVIVIAQRPGAGGGVCWRKYER